MVLRGLTFGDVPHDAGVVNRSRDQGRAIDRPAQVRHVLGMVPGRVDFSM
jgi:hypothetical protein